MFLLSEIHEEDTDEINFEVLHPENPIMIRFQNALRQMLENKLNHVRAEVAQTVIDTFLVSLPDCVIRALVLTLRMFLEKRN